MSKHDKKEERNLLITSVLITSIILFLALLSPILLTKSEALGIVPSNISDVYSGVNIMTPFVAIASVVVTFLAFYVQYKANVKLKEDAKRQELDLKRQQLERQFYEMLKIHKDNVNEIKWSYWCLKESSSRHIPHDIENYHYPSWYSLKTEHGRNVFDCYKYEIHFIYNVLIGCYGLFEDKCRNKKIPCKPLNRNEMFKLAYGIFYYGKDFITNERNRLDFKSLDRFIKDTQIEFLQKLNDIHLNIDTTKNILGRNDYDLLNGHDCLNGHFYELNHYYRHLYQMVKCVANYDDEIVSYEEKRKYLRMLRAQLTNNEQLMLFYNWKSGYGKDWEYLNGNHFFTDYRMIHNIDYHDVIFIPEKHEDLCPSILIAMMKKCNPDIKIEHNKKSDHLFEFQNDI